MRLTIVFALLSFMFVTQPAFSQEPQELPEGIMAIRGEGVVSRDEFEANLSKIPEKDRSGVLLSAARVEKLMGDLLLTSQLKADAVAAGFDKGLMQYRMQLAADRELANAWLDHYVNMQPPANYEAMAHEYYLLNKDSIKTVETRDLTHLLVSNKNSSNEEAAAQAQIYLDQILEDPSVFEELILVHSEDPSAKSNKGSFKNAKKGDMVRPFEDAAWALETPGEFSGLVFTQYGVHIIRLDKITPPRTMAFDEIKRQLIEMKEKEHKERIRYNYLTELGTVPWNVSEEELKALVDRYFGEDTPVESSAAEKSE